MNAILEAVCGFKNGGISKTEEADLYSLEFSLFWGVTLSKIKKKWFGAEEEKKRELNFFFHIMALRSWSFVTTVHPNYLE